MLKKGVLLGLLLVLSTPAIAEESPIHWQDWSNSVFDTAKKEHKLVLLDVRAVWCHWCHVMDDTTYRDPGVIKELNQHYVIVSVDQDSHPDLSHRYEDYGWPATIIFAADGTEIAKRRGYIEPEPMKTLLAESFADPKPNADQTGNAAPSSHASLTENERESILASIVNLYDKENAGWGRRNKFLEINLMEMSLTRALSYNRVFRIESGNTLDASMNLIDPVWGGVYQYSDSLDWKSPHFEKIMSIQSAYLFSYAYGYRVFQEEKYREAAGKVIQYLTDFMTSPEGAFYTSQDADVSEKITGHDYYPLDDAGRHKLGMPKIDKNIYPSENGAMISSLLVYYSMTADKTALDKALRAANWLAKHRAIAGGGFTHGETDKDGPFLSDTLAMAKAMLDIYAATAERVWLTRAEESAHFMATNFLDAKEGGFYGKVSHTNDVLKPFKKEEENIAAARFFNLLSYYSSDKSFKKMAMSALRSVSSVEQVRDYTFNPGLLMADDELRAPPLHLTVVGPKNDASAMELFKAAIAVVPLYKETQWYDKREGPLPGSDITFPDLPKPAVFVCTGTTCSLPMFDVTSLHETIDKVRDENN